MLYFCAYCCVVGVGVCETGNGKWMDSYPVPIVRYPWPNTLPIKHTLTQLQCTDSPKILGPALQSQISSLAFLGRLCGLRQSTYIETCFFWPTNQFTLRVSDYADYVRNLLIVKPVLGNHPIWKLEISRKELRAQNIRMSKFTEKSYELTEEQDSLCGMKLINYLLVV